MNRYIVFVAVIVLQVAFTFSGPTDRVKSHVAKRANDLLTNEIDLSLNDVDNTEALKRLRLVQRQAETNNAHASNNTLCDVISSFVAQGANTLSTIVTDMTRILQQLCNSATQAFLHPGQNTSSNSS